MLTASENIESGKQHGYEICTVIEHKKYWISAAIQKYNGKYKAYVSKIEESNMISEIYDFNIVKTFPNLNDAYTFVRQKSKKVILNH